MINLTKIMANTTIYNFRFYPKYAKEVTDNEYNIILRYLFKNPNSVYRQGRLVSYSTPLIFEIEQQKRFIELLIEPYKNYNFLMNLDELKELDVFDIWTRSMDDGTGIDYYNLYDEANGGICRYKYEKIKFYTNEYFFKYDLNPVIPIGKPNTILEYNQEGQYHSGMCIGAKGEGSYPYDLNSKLALKDKYDLLKGDYDKSLDCSEWFSDDKIYSLMQTIRYQKGIDKIEFLFNGRATRIYDKGNMNECYMIDDLDNCINEEFLDYIVNRQKNL